MSKILLIDQPWTSQPQYPAQPASWLNDVISCASTPGVDTRAKITVAGSPVRTVIPSLGKISGGVGCTYATISDHHVINNTRTNVNEYTLICIARIIHVGSFSDKYLDDDDVSTRCFQLRRGKDSFAVEFIPFSTSGTPNIISVSTAGAYNDGNGVIGAIVARARANDQRLDVSYCGSASSTTLTSIKPLGSTIWVGAAKIGTGCERGILAHMIVPRFLSDAETKLIINNPWQIFAPEQIPIFIPDASTGAPTLSALTASLITSSGCRATVQVAR